MSREHQESLKEQCIVALAQGVHRAKAEVLFEQHLWPVLDKAIEAGELIVWRNTQKQIPVHIALQRWLKGCLAVVRLIHQAEKSVTVPELLRVLYQLEEGAKKALKDAEEIDVPSQLPGSPVANS